MAPDKVYNALLKYPRQTVDFQMQSGASVGYDIWQDVNTGEELLKCDLCEKFLSLISGTSTKHSTAPLRRHRDSGVCKERVEQMAKARERSSQVLTFENTFQEAGPSRFGPSRIMIRGVASESDQSTPTSEHFPGTPTTASSTLTPRASLANIRPLVQSLSAMNSYLRLPPSSPPPHSPQSDESQNGETAGLSENQSSTEDETLPEDVCTGQLIQWTAGSVWDTYAYQQHEGDQIGWTPIGYEGANWIRLQSKSCRIFLYSDKELYRRACNKCFALLNSPQLVQFMERANRDTVPHTPWKYLNARQLKNMLVVSRKRTDVMKLKALNFKRRISRMEKRLNDYQRMVMLISQNKIVGVSRILAVALRNGANANAICVKLRRAIEGTYKPVSGWEDRELDIAFLVKAIGGPRLLYALQKAEGYPSLSTLRKRKVIPEVSTSIKIPSNSELDLNISALLGKEGRKPPSIPSTGQVVVIDGVAIEQAVRYDFKRNCLVGLCREHSENINMVVNGVEDIHHIARALEEKVCHHGKDATVLGIAPITDKTDYHVTPLVLSSSCKSEKGEELASWVGRFIQAYRQHPDGEKRHGPIYTLATDGESSFRKLRFLLGLGETLDKTSKLSRILYALPGLNRQTGLHGLLGTCDPKHIVKRFATMIRSPKGILIGSTHITSADALRALQHLPGMSPEKAGLLLHPADKQNVPKAVNLIQSLLDLKGQNIIATPSERDRIRCIGFIAKVLGYFLMPFIDVTMTLSAQIRSLSTYSHLLTALYLKHGLDFMTSALYADSQAIAKNIIFTTARLQLADASMGYHILFEGTDRLENLFSHVRTQDHARNFDIQQLSHKMSIAAEIEAILQRHKDLDRGHIRRNLVNARGVDHMNPKSWIGDVCVGNVDIKAEYIAGRTDANNLLTTHFSSNAEAVDFDYLFSNEDIDHLRPNKEYIGSRAVDESGDLDEDDGTTTGSLANSGPEIESDGDNSLEDARDIIDTNEFNGLEVVQKDLLNPPLTKPASHYLMVKDSEKGTEVKHYIPTLVTEILGSDRERKALVSTRPLRAQGVTVEEALRKAKSEDAANFSGDKLDANDGKVKSGDLGAILMSVGDEICLAVAEIMNFKQGTSMRNLDAVDVDDLDAEGGKRVTVAVQIIKLVSSCNAESQELTWWWPQDHVQILDNLGGPVLRRHMVTQVPGKLLHLLTPNIIHDSAGTPIWSLNHSDLERTLNSAWEDLEPNSNAIIQTVKTLPNVSGPGSQQLPYRLLDEGTMLLFVPKSDIPIPLNLVKLAGDVAKPCYLCNEEYRISAMRNHVGTHILKAHRDVIDDSLENGQEIGMNPCGWCGRDGCTTHLVENTQSVKVISNCEYHYQNMQYHRAKKPSERSPCTNVPLICPLCPTGSTGHQVTFWKYEFMTHVLDRHLTDSNELPFLPLDLWATTHISKWEEHRMGIPHIMTDQWRDTFQVLDSDDIRVIEEEAGGEEGDAEEDDEAEEEVESERQSRKRGMSMASTTSRQGSPAKKHHG